MSATIHGVDRAARLAAIAGLLAGAALLLAEPLRAVRRDVLLQRALDALEAGLARWHAHHATYPDATELAAGELAATLVAGGALARVPDNPDTARAYGSVDLETDLVFYTAENDAAGYRLEALSTDGTRVVAVRRGPRR